MTPRIRASLASLAFLGLAGLHAWSARPYWWWPDGLAIAALVLAALVCHARSLAPHVAARALAWLHVAIGGLGAVLGGGRELAIASVLGAAAIAALGRGSYDSRAAAAGFEPVGYRGAFLAASTASVALGLLLAWFGLAMLAEPGDTAEALGSLALASALFAASALVLRMRSLGVLLGVVIAALAMVAGPLEMAWGGELAGLVVGVLWISAALPALALGAPVAWSRIRPVRGATGTPRGWSTALAAVIALAALAGALARA